MSKNRAVVNSYEERDLVKRTILGRRNAEKEHYTVLYSWMALGEDFTSIKHCTNIHYQVLGKKVENGIAINIQVTFTTLQ